MSSQTDKDEIATANTTPSGQKPAIRLRVWPALVILLLQFIASQISSTSRQAPRRSSFLTGRMAR